GSGGSATTINVYTTKTESAAGFNGTSPTGKTPVGYEVRKTDFQITGAYSWGAWVKTSTSARVSVLSKSYLNNYIDILDTGYFRFTINTSSYRDSSVTVNNNSWHQVVAVFNPSTSQDIYVDGVLANGTLTGGLQVGNLDYSSELVIGATLTPGAIRQFPGSIDEPFVTAEALTAGQIFDMYNRGRN
ncbi:MAG: LamG-like jellyroll fold domain-containing protein, partial [Candidatus Roizmanbacteria bacterium]